MVPHSSSYGPKRRSRRLQFVRVNGWRADVWPLDSNGIACYDASIHHSVFLQPSLSVSATAPSSSRPVFSRPPPPSSLPLFPRNFRRVATCIYYTYYFSLGRVVYIVKRRIKMNVERSRSSDVVNAARCILKTSPGYDNRPFNVFEEANQTA